MNKRFKIEVPIIVTIVLTLFTLYRHYRLGASRTTLLIYILTFGLLLYLIIMISKLSKSSWWIIKEKVQRDIVFILIAIVSFLIPVIVHYIIFPENEIYETDILNFYGNYITFLGTFSLGYIIYKRDGLIRLEEKITKAKLLHSCLDSIIDQANILISNPERIKVIEYDLYWKSYYFEISELVYNNELQLRTEIESIFIMVDSVNYYLERGENEKAQNEYKSFIKWEKYWPTKFNFIEASGMIYEIAYLWGSIKPHIAWDDKEKTNQDIKKYGEQFFHIIEIWIYNYMIKNSIDCLEKNIIIFNLVDWLMTNKELEELVRSQYDKRIISAIVSEVGLEMNKKSKLLNFCWGEFSFK